MVYTEIRNISKRKYYYRVVSIRKGDSVSKKRIYLGIDLDKAKLSNKVREADKNLLYKNVKNKEIDKIKVKILGVLKKNNVKKAGIFGSYSRGEQKKRSDIDIAVEIADKKMSLLGFIRLIRILETILKRKVDLVEYSAIKPRIKERILNEEIRII